MPARPRLVLVAAGAAAASAVLPFAAPAAAAPPVLQAEVGKGWAITLKDAKGGKVKELRPGAYMIRVSDTTDVHNFHLTGPGVDRDSGVKTKLQASRQVTLVTGRYTFVCDPHRSMMKGSFEVK